MGDFLELCGCLPEGIFCSLQRAKKHPDISKLLQRTAGYTLVFTAVFHDLQRKNKHPDISDPAVFL